MKNYTIYYNGCATYIANSEEEAITMFENDDNLNNGSINIEEVEEND